MFGFEFFIGVGIGLIASSAVAFSSTNEGFRDFLRRTFNKSDY